MQLYLLKHDPKTITKDSVLFNTSDKQIDILVPYDTMSSLIIELADVKFKIGDLDKTRLKTKKADLELSLKIKTEELSKINRLLNE